MFTYRYTFCSFLIFQTQYFLQILLSFCFFLVLLKPASKFALTRQFGAFLYKCRVALFYCRIILMKMSQALNMDYYEVMKHEGPVESGHLELDWIWAQDLMMSAMTCYTLKGTLHPYQLFFR